jgi:2-keto-3-deoxy-6-phosphogluconate aldolase
VTTRGDENLKEVVLRQTKATGVLPCIKLHQKEDFLAYAKAMYDGGARYVEIVRKAKENRPELP